MGHSGRKVLHFCLEQMAWSLSYSGAGSMDHSHTCLLWHLTPLGSLVHRLVLPILPSEVNCDCQWACAACSTGSPYRNKDQWVLGGDGLLTSHFAVVITVWLVCPVQIKVAAHHCLVCCMNWGGVEIHSATEGRTSHLQMVFIAFHRELCDCTKKKRKEKSGPKFADT